MLKNFQSRRENYSNKRVVLNYFLILHIRGWVLKTVKFDCLGYMYGEPYCNLLGPKETYSENQVAQTSRVEDLNFGHLD